MGPSQFGTASRAAPASRVAVGGNTTDDRKIPAHVSAILIGAGILLFAFDRAKFKMVVGVS